MPTAVKPDMSKAPAFSPRLLRRHRRAAGLTLEALAVLVGKEWSTVIRYERGVFEPAAAVLGPLAHALGVRVGDLFEVDPPASAVESRV